MTEAKKIPVKPSALLNRFLPKKYLLAPQCLLVAAIIVNIVAFVVFLLWDNTPPHWDASRHLFTSLSYLSFAKGIVTSSGNALTDAIGNFFTSYFYYPPFFYWLSLPFMVVFGKGYHALILSNLLWAALMLTSFWGWAKSLGLHKTTQVCGAFFLLSSPLLIGLQRSLLLDYAALATVFCMLYCIERYYQKLDFTWATITGLSLGLAIMTKWTTAIPAAFIIAAYAVRLVFEKKIRGQNLFRSYALLCAGISIGIMALASFWYFPHLTQLRIDYVQNAITAGQVEGDASSLVSSSAYYLSTLVRYYLGIPWLIVFVVTAIGAITISIRQKWKTDFLLFFSLAFFIFLLLYYIKQPNKDIRYIIAWYIPLTGLLMWGIERIMSLGRIHRHNWILGSTFTAAIISIAVMMYGTNSLAAGTLSDYKDIGYAGLYTAKPTHQKWPIYDALAAAQTLSAQYSNPALPFNCLVNDSYHTRSSIASDFSSITVYTNPGTMTGLAELYALHYSALNNKSCFIVIGANMPAASITADKYPNYEVAGRYSGDQGFNLVLLRRVR